ncbi:MAG: glycerophosphodiester phosphodiesterase [Clostridia bacterium]|nr:glycerophosphodiester phosphodiesterase [Clostridia bacterium]
MEKIIVEGHRGFCAEYPENTLISFEKAIELGVDAVEFDVWLSSDKVPVIMHDSNAWRTCGTDSEITGMTYAEIKDLDPCYPERFGDIFRGQKVPSLDELLDLIVRKRPDRGLLLGVEIKLYTEETVDLTVDMLRRYGVFDRCFFYAFNGRIIRYIKEKYNGRTMGYPDFQMSEFCGYEWYDDIGLNMRLVRSELLPFYCAKGLPMHFYCADTEEDADLCIREGASLITANDPRPLLRVLGRRDGN